MLSTQINQADVSEWAPRSQTMAVHGVPDQPSRFMPEGATKAHYVSEIPLQLRIDALRADVGAVKESLRLIMKHHGIE